MKPASGGSLHPEVSGRPGPGSPGPGRGRRGGAAAILVCIAAAAGCSRFGSSTGPSTSARVALPCDPPASHADGLRAERESPPARFSTDGSGLYVRVSGFEHSQLFDPKIAMSAVYVGRADTAPTYDARSNTVTNAVLQADARENQPARLALPAGRYWLWASNAPSLGLSGCAAGSVTDAVSGG